MNTRILVIALACASSVASAGPNLLSQIPSPPASAKDAYDACTAPGHKGHDTAFQAAYAAAKQANEEAAKQLLAEIQKHPSAATLPPRLMLAWQKFQSEPAAPPEVQSQAAIFQPIIDAHDKKLAELQQKVIDCKLGENRASQACASAAAGEIKTERRKLASQMVAMWPTYLAKASQNITWDLRPVPSEFDPKSLFVRRYVLAGEGNAIAAAQVIDSVEEQICGDVGAIDPRSP